MTTTVFAYENRTVVCAHKAERRIVIELGDEDWITREMLLKSVSDAVGIIDGTVQSRPDLSVERIVWCKAAGGLDKPTPSDGMVAGALAPCDGPVCTSPANVLVTHEMVRAGEDVISEYSGSSVISSDLLAMRVYQAMEHRRRGA